MALPAGSPLQAGNSPGASARGFCASSGELRREVHAVGVPMRRTVDGEIVAFNCIVPAFMVKKGQLEDDLGPRLVAMVRNIEANLGLH